MLQAQSWIDALSKQMEILLWCSLLICLPPRWSQTLLVVAVVKNSNRTGVCCGAAPGDWWLITIQLLLKAAGPLLLITAFVAKRRLSHRRSLLEPLPPCKSIKITQEIASIHQKCLGWIPRAGSAQLKTGTVHYSLFVCVGVCASCGSRPDPHWDIGP